MHTSVCEMLGIKYPIFQGGMAHISDAELAAAVSNAGGLGIISAASGDVALIEKEIDKIRTLTDKPFGVNVMLMGKNIEEIAHLLAAKKVPVITTGAGNPQKYITMWKDAGIKVIPVVPSAALAKLSMRAGADAVIAEGGESGGHVGDITTMALVPQVCDVVDIPVIAAGGIADGRGAAAAFMLGAQGIQIGTRFLSAFECNINPVYKAKVIKANDTSTIVTGKRLGHPVRSLKSKFSRAYAKAEYTDISDEDLEQMAVGTLRAAVVDGDEEKGCFLAGQIAGLVNKEESAADIIKQIFDEAEKVLNRADSFIIAD
ncbi:MAG: nitronate monooxygenase [Butyrivibrio sp.]